ncbi:MAG: ribonuclease P protein component [Actinomycetota bacterium]
MQRPLRLTSSRDFDRVFRSGHRGSAKLLTAVALAGDPARPARVGLAVGSSVGGAVRRNRVKRVLREAIRTTCIKAGTDVVLVARPGIADSSLDETRAELAAALDRAGAGC